MDERSLFTQVTQMCNLRDLWWWDFRTTCPHCHRRVSVTTRPGWPDLIILGTAGGLIVELKSDEGRRSMAQIRTGQRIGNARWGYRLWRPDDLNDGTITSALDELALRR